MQKTKLKAARPQTKKTRLLACQDRVNFQVLFRFPSGQFNNWQCYLLLIYLGTVQLNDFIILRGYPEPLIIMSILATPHPFERVNGGRLAIMWNSQKNTIFFSGAIQHSAAPSLPRLCVLRAHALHKVEVGREGVQHRFRPIFTEKISFLWFV